MAQLVAAFASSHSVMLTCELVDWQKGFRDFDPKGSYFDRRGQSCTYDDLLAAAPPDAAARVTDAAIARRFDAVHAAMSRLRRDIEAAALDVLVICGDDQKELFNDNLGEAIRNGVRMELPESEWYRRAQMRRLEERVERSYPVDAALARHLIEHLVDENFDIAALKGLPEGQHEGHAFSFMHRT
jgi:hypothetical protein